MREDARHGFAPRPRLFDLANATGNPSPLLSSRHDQVRRPGARDAAGIRYALDTLYVVDVLIDMLQIDCSFVVR